MPAKPVTIGEHHFAKKGDAVAFFQEILYRYNLGDKVSTADEAILRLLIDRHPEAAGKIGAGIASFSVRSGDFGTRCFWINRVDNTAEKFSFRACL
ncbi:DCL family protein [Parasphingorhabdus sp.]|uniref:DCL family protein n=1 Tax=Parasphingorhabdus sp. TaxID=2709688 RepID=UPI003A95DDDE